MRSPRPNRFKRSVFRPHLLISRKVWGAAPVPLWSHHFANLFPLSQMSAEESELSGPPTTKRRGPARRSRQTKQTTTPRPNVNRPVCHNIFPHCPTIPGDLFWKEKGKNIITVTLKRQNTSSSCPPSGRICSLFQKSSFSGTQNWHYVYFLQESFLLKLKMVHWLTLSLGSHRCKEFKFFFFSFFFF